MSEKRTVDDESVVLELRAYQAALEAGEQPDRDAMLARFPELSEELAGCLDGLDLMYRVAPHLQDEAPGDLDLTPATALGDFRILREVGRGGMGVVYEADQMSLGRRVALKVLPFAAVLDSRYLRRFKNEAQAAAHLHHTSIVPVHAVGCERGVHYYAMQFIEGPTLAGLIDELKSFAGNGRGRDSTPALDAIARERTTESPRFCRAVAHLGIQAAEALDYAHESGVIHRDIKPPNLIVDEKGHLWITDFGLASTRNDTGLTVTGDIVGTMRYMSPEQALGKRVPVDHRTDIYSLAVTLYELLTLEQAFPGDDPAVIMQEVAFREPTRPRALNPATPPELETILLKAMSKDPADRYTTAQELADDLRRFTEDRPIHARRPSAFKRTVQWSRRHPAVMWATAVVLVLAIAGLIAGNIVIANERDDAKNARDEATVANAALEANSQTLKANTQKMGDVVDSMLSRVADELANQPHMSQLRKELLEEALAFYLDFLEQKRDKPAVPAEVVRAYSRVASIYWHLGQRQASEETYKEAIEFGEAQIGQFPDSPELRYYVAYCYKDLAAGLGYADRFPEVERAVRRSLSMTEELLATFPPKPAYRRNLAECQGILGEVLEHVGRSDDAAAAYQRALGAWQGLVNDYPNEREYQHGLASALRMLAGRSQSFAEAEGLLRKSVASIEKLLSETPTHELRHDHGRGWAFLGNLLEHAHRFEDARDAHEKARAIFEELVRDFPNLPNDTKWLAIVYRRLCVVCGELGRAEEARQAGRDAVRVLDELVKKHPDIPYYQLELAAAHGDLGWLLGTAGRLQDAQKEFQRKIEILNGLESTLNNRAYRYDRAAAYVNLANTLSDPGQKEGLYRQSLAMFRDLADDYADIPYRRHVASSLLALADVLQSNERNEEAKKCYDEAIDVMRRLVDEFSENPDFRYYLGRTHYCFALYYANFVGRPRDAAREYRNALEVKPDNVEWLNEFAWYLVTCPDPAVRNAREAVALAERAVGLADEEPAYWNTLGVALCGAGKWKEAIPALKKSIELTSGGSAFDWFFLAMAQWKLGEKTKARQWYWKAVAWMEKNKPDDEDLNRFRAEAEALLGLDPSKGSKDQRR
ncbi:MAG: serine/threonine-protein kinase [Planctomycetota bacterium]|jgi:serine/threonine protein kinase/tetratricopeptide (TPR) repeat protein